MKRKFGTVVVVLLTLVLAGVAIFTAIRLYQLRQVSVAPNAPSSQPKAATIAGVGELCGGIQGIICQTGLSCIYSDGTTHAPSPDASGTCQSGVVASCSLSFSLTVATPTPSPTPTASPTATPVPQCNSTCTSSSQCSSTLICNIATGATSGNCRKASCLADSDCICATPTPTGTPGATPTPTGTPHATPTITPTGTSAPTPTAPSLPQSGTDWPTYFGVGIGVLVILASILLAI